MISFQQFNEIAWEGNVGIHELMQFYAVATDEQKEELSHYLETKQIDKAVELLYQVTGTKLNVTA